MIDKNIGARLPVFNESDLEKIKEITDKPTYKRLIAVLKERNKEEK
jgi:hypothetical protein